MKRKYLKWAMPFIVVLFIMIVPIITRTINNDIAYQTAQDVKAIALPDKTEYVEMFSAAGKLVGNGNGMQYLGGILIKSELPIDSIRAYYSQYASNEWEYLVDKQEGNYIRFVEHGEVSLHTNVDGDNFYIVYSWGQSNSFLTEFDARGH